MNIEETRQHHEYLVRLSRLNMNNENWKRIDFLLSELDRLTAAMVKKAAEYSKAEIEANSLAVSLYKQFYQNDAPQWKTLDTVAGVITQIDNMVAGICEELVKAKNLAAARLIELNDIRDREASKVAGVCYQIACGCAYGYTAAKEIRETYKVSIE